MVIPSPPALNRLRSTDGRFASRLPSRTSQLHVWRERKRVLEGRQFGRALYERLLDVMFLPGIPGDDKEWIMTQTGVGPIPTIISKLFRPKFKISPSLQARLKRTRYFNGAIKKSSELPRMYIFASDDPSQTSYRRRVYKGRRLPKLSRQTTGMDPVRDWINYAIEQQALADPDTERAYDTFRQVLESHTLVNGQSAYPGYPSHENEGRNARQSVPSTDSNELEGNEAAIAPPSIAEQANEHPRHVSAPGASGHENLAEGRVGIISPVAQSQDQNYPGDDLQAQPASPASPAEDQETVDVFRWNEKCQNVLRRVFHDSSRGQNLSILV